MLVSVGVLYPFGFAFELGHVGLLYRGEGADLIFAVLVKSFYPCLLGLDGTCVLSSMAP